MSLFLLFFWLLAKMVKKYIAAVVKNIDYIVYQLFNYLFTKVINVMSTFQIQSRGKHFSFNLNYFPIKSRDIILQKNLNFQKYILNFILQKKIVFFLVCFYSKNRNFLKAIDNKNFEIYMILGNFFKYSYT